MMRLKSVIVDTLDLDFLEGNVEKLSQLLEKITLNKRNPIVLIKDDGDDLLRKIPALGNCDLVFTKKSQQPFQGLFAGLQGAGTCAFYIPHDSSYGEEALWLGLEQKLVQLPYMNNIHRIIQKDFFPWLITPAGSLYLKSKDDSYELEQDHELHTLFLEP